MGTDFFSCRPPSFLVRAAAAAAVGGSKKLLQFCWKLPSKYLMGRCSSLHEDFVRVKTPMGLERFEVRFFIWEKFTKIKLALSWVCENILKLAERFFMMFRTIWLRYFFLFQKSYGNTTRLKFFWTTKKKSVFFPGSWQWSWFNFAET